jgi:hypothetical protein
MRDFDQVARSLCCPFVAEINKFAQNRVVLRHSRLARADHIVGGPPGSELRDPANYRCSLGTNAVLGLVTNGLLAVSRDGGAEN